MFLIVALSSFDNYQTKFNEVFALDNTDNVFFDTFSLKANALINIICQHPYLLFIYAFESSLNALF